MGNNCVSMRERNSKDGYIRPIFNSIWGPSSREGLEYVNNEVGCIAPLSISKEHESSLLVQRKPPDLVVIFGDGKNTSKPINPEELMKIVLKEVEKQSRVATITRILTDNHGIKGNKVIVGVGRPKPVEAPKPKIPSSVRKTVSAGLQVDSVLRTKTCHLKEHYDLGDKLGNGQFGTTFLCVERATGKQYACKSIAKRKLLTQDDVDDVWREVNIMHHLSGSPNIISIKDAYEDSVAVHVVMELCTGGELFDGIVKVGHYSERKAAELCRTIVGVIKTCHSLGVMHRDLKPENFLLVNQGEDSPITAIDFGLSVFFKPGETLNEVVGSPFYVAPEVLSKCYGPEADIWSAGVILYILLSGVPPFWGETIEEIFKEVLQGGLDFSFDPWPHISESAKDLVRKMLVRDPKRRLTAHEVLCHSWIRVGGVAPDKPLDPPVLSRFTKFCYR